MWSWVSSNFYVCMYAWWSHHSPANAKGNFWNSFLKSLFKADKKRAFLCCLAFLRWGWHFEMDEDGITYFFSMFQWSHDQLNSVDLLTMIQIRKIENFFSIFPIFSPIFFNFWYSIFRFPIFRFFIIAIRFSHAPDNVYEIWFRSVKQCKSWKIEKRDTRQTHRQTNVYFNRIWSKPWGKRAPEGRP